MVFNNYEKKRNLNQNSLSVLLNKMVGNKFLKSIFYFVAFVVLIFCFNRVSAVSANDSLNQVYQCGTLDSPGAYTMNQSIIQSVNALCINLTVQNIALNCAGYNITSTTANKAGVHSEQINTTIKNCVITMRNTNGGRGIYLSNANNSYILNNTLNSQFDGLILANTSYTRIENNTASSNRNYGITLVQSPNNNVTNFVGNSNLLHSLRLYLSSNNIITSVTANSSSGDAIVFSTNSNNNTLTNLIASYGSDMGMNILASSNNTFINITTNSNAPNSNQPYGIYLNSNSSGNQFFNVTSNSNDYGIYITSSANNNFQTLTLRDNGKAGIYMDSNSNNTFQTVSFDSNNYGIYSLSSNSTFSSINMTHNLYAIFQSGSIITFSGSNKFYDNLNPAIINSSLINENLERTYAKNSNVGLNISIYYPNGTIASDFDYNITVYPDSSYSVTNNSNNLTINFTAVKEGIYGVKINVTLSDLNITETRNFAFLVGNTSSSQVRHYMHSDRPSRGQGKGTGTNSGAAYSYATTTDEALNDLSFIQYSPDQVINQYFLIKNISLGWFYKGTDTPLSKIQRYVSFDTIADYNQSLPDSSSYVFNVTNFTNLNITSDYPWRIYWIAFKLSASSPYALSNLTQQSYADITYLYSGPQITYFGENTGSDIKNARILSSTFVDSEKKTSTIQLDGAGNFTMVFNLTSANYSVKYDDILCPSQNCTVNSNSGGLINVTFYLGSEHTLSLVENATPPNILVNSPANTEYTTTSVLFNLTVTDSAAVDTCKYSLDGGAANTTIANITSSEWSASLTLAEGSYTASFYCNDTFGNLNNSESRSFSINLPDAADSGSSGSLPSFTVGEVDLEKGYEKQMREGFKITFNAGGGKTEKHSLVVKDVSKDSATIVISSEPITMTLKVNETKKVDLDTNGFYDLEVSLKEIKGYFAKIGLKTINEKIIGEEIHETKETVSENGTAAIEEDKKEVNLFLIFASAVIVIILIICLIIFSRLGKKRKLRKLLRGY